MLAEELLDLDHRVARLGPVPVLPGGWWVRFICSGRGRAKIRPGLGT